MRASVSYDIERKNNISADYLTTNFQNITNEELIDGVKNYRIEPRLRLGEKAALISSPPLKFSRRRCDDFGEYNFNNFNIYTGFKSVNF